MKLSKPIGALDSTPTELLPHYSAVKLTKVVMWVNPLDSGDSNYAEPPTFIWKTENSNGRSYKLQRGTVLTGKRSFIPNGRAAFWSNDSSSTLTLGESLFEIEHANETKIDIYFTYVETCGSRSHVTVTSTGFTTSSGTVYPPLDNMVEGAMTVGPWLLNPIVNLNTCTVTTGNKPSIFTRVL
jgi:hypothetical protein